MLTQLVYYFLPEKLRFLRRSLTPSEELRRAEMVILSGAFVGPVVLLTGILLLTLQGSAASWTLGVTIGGGALFCLIPITIKWQLVPTKIVAHLTLIVALTVVVARAIPSGGLGGPTIPWFVMLPMWATLMISIRAGLVWLAIVLSSLVALFFVTINSSVVMGSSPISISLIVLSLLAVGVALLSIAWERERRRYITFVQMCDVEYSGRKRMEGLSKLAGSMAHHVNNPLCVLMGHNDYMLERVEEVDLETSERQEWIKHLQSNRYNIARISKLTTSILTYTGHYSNIEISTKRLGEFLELIKAEVLEQGFSSVVNITYQLDAKNNSFVSGHIDLLVHLFVNLITNSIEALPEVDDPWVRLEIESKDQNAIFTLTDSGAGIPLEVQEHMFEPFFTSRNVVERSGIGLYLSKSLVKQYGGTIAYNHESENTQFIVTLPLIN
jgi:signal transduction histidine kinase